MSKQKLKVLIVDDEPGFTRLLQANLETMGEFDVRVENWPEDACARAREFRPDVILLDLIMYRLPGGNVRMQLQADPELRSIPIVLLTGAVHPQPESNYNDGLPEWNDGLPYVLKPASDEQIAAAIRQHARQPVTGGD